jgi:uncharacterized membrane protein
MSSNNPDTKTVLCHICQQPKKRWDVLPADMVRDPVAHLIEDTAPGWGPDQYICLADLNRFRNDYVATLIKGEKGTLTHLEQDVIKSLNDFELVSNNPTKTIDQQWTVGQKIADKVATFGGSWTFIIIFFSFILGWMLLNAIKLGGYSPFDAYPFIFLNLVLSCIAAVQAPIIMMSQNRQEARDRVHMANDYQVNLKAELEIRHLNTKMDLLLNDLWIRLMDIQTIQLDMLQSQTPIAPANRPAIK